jgi:molybdenum cofactor biosynthesis protein MoaC
MIDVSPKFNSLRYAMAEGFLYGKQKTLKRVFDKTVPKGDVTEVARAAAIFAAKRCADWITFCHPIPLDWVEVKLEPKKNKIKVTAEVRSVWKTGVEMEAITAVSAALLNAYDMLKPLDDSLSFGDIRVVNKKGGKSDFSNSFKKKLKTAILVMSDSTHAGKRKDKSGKIIEEFLADKPVKIDCYEVLPDDKEVIAERLCSLVDKEKVKLMTVIDRSVPGIVEAIRSHGKDRTPFAMLSRGEAGVRGDSVIINLPGSSKGAIESLQALFPGLLHIFPMMQGKGHGKTKKGKKK